MHELVYDGDGKHTHTIVTTESAWDEEQVQTMLEHLEYRRLTRRCGHHPTKGMAADHVRMVDNETVQCLDCYAIEQQRTEFHVEGLKDPNGKHAKTGPCEACAKEVFWISERVPL